MPILSHFPSGGTDTRDATAAAADIANGKTAYVNEQKVTGTSTKVYGPGDTIIEDNITASQKGGAIAWQNSYIQTGTWYSDCDDTYAYYSTGGYISVRNISDGTSAGTMNAVPATLIAHDQDTVYTEDSSGNVYAFSKSTKAQLWKVNIGSTNQALSILPLSDSILVSTSSIMCRMSKSNGSTIWSTSPYVTARFTDANYIYAYNGQSVIAFRLSDGSSAWNKNVAYYIRDMLVDDYVYVVFWTNSSENNMQISKFDKNGGLIWTSIAFGALDGKITADSQHIYALWGILTALNKTDGTTAWSTNTIGSSTQGTLFYAHNSLYISGNISFGMQNPRVICGALKVNPIDGSFIWVSAGYDPGNGMFRMHYSNPDIVCVAYWNNGSPYFQLQKIYAISKYTVNS